MSRDQLIAAYVDGRMSRRTLIRRLAIGGVSIGAATYTPTSPRPGPRP